LCDFDVFTHSDDTVDRELEKYAELIALPRGNYFFVMAGEEAWRLKAEATANSRF